MSQQRTVSVKLQGTVELEDIIIIDSGIDLKDNRSWLKLAFLSESRAKSTE